jgi:phage-related protein
VQAKLKAEEVKQAALEAERKATMEAKTKAAMEAEKRAEKDAIESSKKVTSGVAQDTESSILNTETKESGMGFLFSLFITF